MTNTKTKSASRNPRYLLIGSGRLATHLRFYLTTLDIPVLLWSRRLDENFKPVADARAAEERLRKFSAEADVILLAISDAALPEWVSRPEFKGKKIVHFAGARSFPNASGFHPLMTFSRELYEPPFYTEIPFIADRGFDYRAIFPFLDNPIYEISPEEKPLYHALVHMAANFPAQLWVNVMNQFDQKLHLPREILSPILRQSLTNTLADGVQALTGPVVRGDSETLNLHRKAVAPQKELSELYNAWTDWALKFKPHLPEETP